MSYQIFMSRFSAEAHMFENVSATEYLDTFNEALRLLGAHSGDKHDLAHAALEHFFSSPAHTLEQSVSLLDYILEEKTCNNTWAACTLVLRDQEQAYEQVEAELDLLRLYLKALDTLDLGERAAFLEYLGNPEGDIRGLDSLILKLREALNAKTTTKKIAMHYRSNPSGQTRYWKILSYQGVGWIDTFNQAPVRLCN